MAIGVKIIEPAQKSGEICNSSDPLRLFNIMQAQITGIYCFGVSKMRNLTKNAYRTCKGSILDIKPELRKAS